MKHLALTLILLTGLVSCAPTVQPVSERNGDTVTVTLSVTEPFYLASLVLTTDAALTADQVDDPRCSDGVLMDGLSPYVMCNLGDLLPGQGTTVTVQSALPVYCTAGGYTSKSAVSLRTIPCDASD